MNTARQILALAALTVPMAALAQDGHLRLPDFSALAARASAHTDITLGGGLLNFARQFVNENDHDPDAAATRRFMADLRSIEVHSYEFGSDHAYSASDIDSVRRQLQSPGWKRLVQTHSAADQEDVDIYVALDGDRPTGLAIIAAEPREFTIVNLVGTIDLKDLASMGGQMGIPRHVVAEATTAAD
jgi:hypothetical protein